MNKTRKVFRVLVLLFAIFIASIAALEILSETADCSSMASGTPPHYQACESRLHADDADLSKYLKELSEKYRQGISPSKEELEKAVIEVNRDAIGGANGIYCNGVAFVSSDLPAQAKTYVRRHELEHAFQHILQMKEENFESAANYAAASEYPLGMIETVVFSIIESRKHFDSTSCHLAALWKVFKLYFLPFAST